MGHMVLTTFVLPAVVAYSGSWESYPHRIKDGLGRHRS